MSLPDRADADDPVKLSEDGWPILDVWDTRRGDRDG